jgi:hypothetical protein
MIVDSKKHANPQAEAISARSIQMAQMAQREHGVAATNLFGAGRMTGLWHGRKDNEASNFN